MGSWNPPGNSARRYNGQADVRRPFPVMVDRVPRDHFVSLVAGKLARVRIHLEEGEVAAGNVHPDAMACLEAVRRPDQVDRHLADFAGSQQSPRGAASSPELTRIMRVPQVHRLAAKDSPGWAGQRRRA
jgi:hypothetical protein